MVNVLQHDKTLTLIRKKDFFYLTLKFSRKNYNLVTVLITDTGELV
jgi:hypothetical protein